MPTNYDLAYMSKDSSSYLNYDFYIIVVNKNQLFFSSNAVRLSFNTINKRTTSIKHEIPKLEHICFLNYLFISFSDDVMSLLKAQILSVKNACKSKLKR